MTKINYTKILPVIAAAACLAVAACSSKETTTTTETTEMAPPADTGMAMSEMAATEMGESSSASSM